jgi:hypothetical protein
MSRDAEGLNVNTKATSEWRCAVWHACTTVSKNLQSYHTGQKETKVNVANFGQKNTLNIYIFQRQIISFVRFIGLFLPPHTENNTCRKRVKAWRWWKRNYVGWKLRIQLAKTACAEADLWSCHSQHCSNSFNCKECATVAILTCKQAYKRNIWNTGYSKMHMQSEQYT